MLILQKKFLFSLCKNLIKNQFYFYSLVITTIIFLSKPAYANMGIPILAAMIPSGVILIIPIIIIEGILAKIILGLSWKYSFQFSAICNLFSSLIGIPVTWILTVIFQFACGSYTYNIVLQSISDYFHLVSCNLGWTIITPDYPHPDPKVSLSWMIPASATILTLIFGIMSILVEGSFGYLRIKPKKSKILIRVIFWSVISNSISYIPSFVYFLRLTLVNLWK